MRREGTVVWVPHRIRRHLEVIVDGLWGHVLWSGPLCRLVGRGVDGVRISEGGGVG